MYLKTLFVLSLSLFILSANAQETDPDVPTAVIKSFNKKFPRAEDVAWNKVDTLYKVNCYYRDRASYAEFTESGQWIESVVDMDIKEMYAPIARYLDENFKKDKVAFIEKATRADKQDYYYVQLMRKSKDSKEPQTIELFFDKTGKIEQVKMPEGVDEMTVVGIDNPKTETPGAVIDTWKKRFPKAQDIEWSKELNPSDTIEYSYFGNFVYRDEKTKAEFLEDGTWIETRVKQSEKDLYKPVLSYILENHYYDDLTIAEKVTRADRNDYYFARLERLEKGQFRPYVFELFFNKTGKIQKVNRPKELKDQYLLTVDIPPAIAKKFNSRFSNAKDVKWETNEGNWKANFTYRENPTVAEYNDSAQWIMTIVELDVKNIYAPVQRTLDKEYSDYKVTFAEKATRQDRNDHYYVELTGKKKGVLPQKQGLYFNKMGKLKEEPLESRHTDVETEIENSGGRLDK
jgi:hypothetical protein